MSPFNPHGYGPRIGLHPRPLTVLMSPTCAAMIITHIFFGIVPRTADVVVGLN